MRTDFAYFLFIILEHTIKIVSLKKVGQSKVILNDFF